MRDKKLKPNKNKIFMKTILKECMGIEEWDTWVSEVGHQSWFPRVFWISFCMLPFRSFKFHTIKPIYRATHLLLSCIEAIVLRISRWNCEEAVKRLKRACRGNTSCAILEAINDLKLLGFGAPFKTVGTSLWSLATSERCGMMYLEKPLALTVMNRNPLELAFATAACFCLGFSCCGCWWWTDLIPTEMPRGTFCSGNGVAVARLTRAILAVSPIKWSRHW